MTRAIIALVFRCKITGGDLATTDEVAAFRWATGADLAGLADEAYAVRVLDALNGGQPAAGSEIVVLRCAREPATGVASLSHRGGTAWPILTAEARCWILTRTLR